MTSGEKRGLREGGWGTIEVDMLISLVDSSAFCTFELSGETKARDCG